MGPARAVKQHTLCSYSTSVRLDDMSALADTIYSVPIRANRSATAREVTVVDRQKKQKVMIGVLAVLILGAGSVFAVRSFTGSGGGASDQGLERGQVERKQRETDTKKAERGTRRRKERKATTAKQTGRKERKKASTRTVRRKGKKQGKTKRLKKTDAKPMG